MFLSLYVLMFPAILQAQIHLVGNLLVWYPGFCAVGVFSVVFLFHVLRRARDVHDISQGNDAAQAGVTKWPNTPNVKARVSGHFESTEMAWGVTISCTRQGCLAISPPN